MVKAIINKVCIPLTNIDIQNILANKGVKVKFLIYKNIKKIKDINRYLPCFILYQLTKDIGHWVCLFRNEEGLSYFDSTGVFPDELLDEKYFNNNRDKVNADYTHLLKKLYDTKEDIIYNDFQLQNPKSLSCGYWVVLRLLTQYIKNDDFVKMFKGDKRRDFTIVEMVNKLI